jgi:hypothetical protein
MLGLRVEMMQRLALILTVLSMSASAAVKIEKISYQGWPNCYRISNGVVEAIVTGDVGPRVIRYGFTGGQNLFKEFQEQMGKSGEPEWRARGGHRLWTAPEDPVLSYAPDNQAVHIEIRGDTIVLTAPVAPLTGLEKQITLRMDAAGTGVEVTHRIYNAGKTTGEFAPWALTMLAQGGTAVHGFPPRGHHPKDLVPTNPLTMWPYTNLADSRLKLLQKYLVLRQDPKNAGEAEKLGTYGKDVWGAYLLHGDLFLKQAHAEAAAQEYPDFGCNFETFTNGDFLELETLGPIRKVAPGESTSHTEHWSLHKSVQISKWDDAELDRVLLPLVGR